MSAVLGPDGRPAQFDGTAWVSADGRHFWNGAAWQPIARPRQGPSGLVIVLAVFVAAVVAFGGYKVFQRVTEPFVGDGVSKCSDRLLDPDRVRLLPVLDLPEPDF